MSTRNCHIPAEFLASLTQSAADLVFTSDADHHILWASASFRDVLAVDPAEIIGTDPAQFIHPDDLDDARARSARLRAGESPSGRERDWMVRMVAADGTVHWMLGSITRVQSADGSLAGFATILHQIDDLIELRNQAEKSASQSQAVIDSMLDPIIVMAGVRGEHGQLIDLLYVDCNDAAWQYNQLTRDQMIGHRLLELFPGQATGGPLPLYFDVLETGEPCILDDYAYPHEVIGSERRYDIRAMRAGQDLLALTWRDVTDRYRDRAALEASERMYRLATEDVTDAVLESDDAMAIRWISPSFEELTGFCADEVLGRNGLEFIVDPDIEQIESALHRVRTENAVAELHLRLRQKNGSTRWVSVRVRRSESNSGDDGGYVSVVRDIDSEIRVREELEHLTRHDMLTGLATRQLFQERVEAWLRRNPEAVSAVLTAGIDRLTQVNDALTYAAGDAVIRAVGARIGTCVEDRSRLARLGGDTFGILAAGTDGAELAERILEAVQVPLTIDDHSVLPSVSIGVARTTPGDTAAELLRRSGLAMGHAEAQGRARWAEAGAAAASAAVHELEYQESIRQAIDESLITGWYQPVVSLIDRSIVGYEVLARWPDGGTPEHSPGVFIPSAEESGFVESLDRRMIENAIARLPDLNGRHLAVNVSMVTLTSPKTINWLVALAADMPDGLRGLELEVTETALRTVNSGLISSMRALQAHGARWLVDDFGTGYSSISHLRDLPVNGLKLDLSFTRGIAQGDERSLTLAKGLAGLAHGLGLDTIAEGVEDERTAQILAEAGWQYAQGYLFGAATATPAP